MLCRLILVAACVSVLAACSIGSGNPGAQPQRPGSYYDQSDNFLDRSGNPLPGWSFMRDGGGGGGGGGGM